MSIRHDICIKTHSPVIRTNASIPAHSSLRAATEVRVNTSRLFGDGGEVSQSSLDGGGMASLASADGFGRGGMMKESAESCTDSVLVSVYVEDMTTKSGWFGDVDGAVCADQVVFHVKYRTPSAHRSLGGLMIDGSPCLQGRMFSEGSR
jgi:hypothetical protein